LGDGLQVARDLGVEGHLGIRPDAGGEHDFPGDVLAGRPHNLDVESRSGGRPRSGGSAGAIATRRERQEQEGEGSWRHDHSASGADLKSLSRTKVVWPSLTTTWTLLFVLRMLVTT